MVDANVKEVSQNLSGQRIMLVGGGGFIGHNLACALSKLGANVLVVDNLMYNNLPIKVFEQQTDMIQSELYRGFLLQRFELLRSSNVDMEYVDARNFIDLSRSYYKFKPTKIVHLSAMASAVKARKDPGLCFDIQLISLRNVLELVRENQNITNQVVFMSSSTVYGDFEGDSVDESTRPQPKGIYANTKFMGERLVRTYHQQHGVGIAIIRPSALYGERCVGQRVSQMFIENALSGKPLLLEGGGDGRLDFTYIEDLVDGIARSMAFHKEGKRETFNITYGNARTIADLAKIVKELVPNAILEERPRAADKPIRGTLSTQRAQEKIGFKANWDLETGYRKFCQWYIEQWEQNKKRLS